MDHGTPYRRIIKRAARHDPTTRLLSGLRPQGLGLDEERSLAPSLSPPSLVLADVRRLGEGQGVRFSLVVEGIPRDGFAVRYRGRLLAYVNTCRHQGLPLDFGDAHFFDDPYDALVCCHHGARYHPESGVCFEGPCVGARLTGLRVEERDGALWCVGLRRTGDDPTEPGG